jgi:hypothetical protein
MFDLQKIADLCYNFVGIRDIPQSSDLATPTKGVFVEDINSLLTFDNIKKCLPEQPSTSGYVTLLEAKFKYWVSDVLSQAVTTKKINNVTRTVLDRTSVYTGTAQLKNTIINRSKLVGFVVKAVKGKDTVIKISSIGLQTTLPQTDLPIYVFHSSQREPIQTLSITTVKSGSFQWVDLDEPIVLNYYADIENGKTYDTGGFFFIGYHQDDLNGSAIRKDINLLSPPCSTCDGGRNYKLWTQWSKFVAISTTEVSGVDKDNVELTDETRYGSSVGINYGMNLGLSVECDLTKFMIETLDNLLEPIKYRITVGLLQEMQLSQRDNVEQDKLKMPATLALYGNPDFGDSGMVGKLKKAMEALDFDTSQLSSACMPSSRNGIRTGRV